MKDWDTEEEIACSSGMACWIAVASSSPPQGREGRVMPSSTPPPTSLVRLQRETQRPKWRLELLTPNPTALRPAGSSLQGQVCDPAQQNSSSEDQGRSLACTKSTDDRVVQSISFSSVGNRTKLAFYFFILFFFLWYQAYSFLFLGLLLCFLFSFFGPGFSFFLSFSLKSGLQFFVCLFAFLSLFTFLFLDQTFFFSFSFFRAVLTNRS